MTLASEKPHLLTIDGMSASGIELYYLQVHTHLDLCSFSCVFENRSRLANLHLFRMIVRKILTTYICLLTLNFDPTLF